MLPHFIVNKRERKISIHLGMSRRVNGEDFKEYVMRFDHEAILILDLQDRVAYTAFLNRLLLEEDKGSQPNKHPKKDEEKVRRFHTCPRNILMKIKGNCMLRQPKPIETLAKFRKRNKERGEEHNRCDLEGKKDTNVDRNTKIITSIIRGMDDKELNTEVSESLHPEAQLGYGCQRLKLPVGLTIAFGPEDMCPLQTSHNDALLIQLKIVTAKFIEYSWTREVLWISSLLNALIIFGAEGRTHTSEMSRTSKAGKKVAVKVKAEVVHSRCLSLNASTNDRMVAHALGQVHHNIICLEDFHDNLREREP
ncbi:hypothetical protein Cgig2_017168 [Carnegiea gigantea]|uniref:Uncharacterized protein n=1 Tax=Carnegiea gigantea TaxID=171969 RepID=A0A9Q1K8Z3_9CARY|nr:hypothetical protein Cgig2_017168 [Carnegiea gigantea]